MVPSRRIEGPNDAFVGSTRGRGSTASQMRIHVVDASEIASMYNFTNRMSLACGMIPNEEYHALAR